MKMKPAKLILIILPVFVLLVNLPGINDMISIFDHRDCNYSDYTGGFTFSEMNLMSRDYDMCLRNFKIYKGRNPEAVLYRHCKVNLLKFWNYRQYLFEDKYKLPYIKWEEVSARRG